MPRLQRISEVVSLQTTYQKLPQVFRDRLEANQEAPEKPAHPRTQGNSIATQLILAELDVCRESVEQQIFDRKKDQPHNSLPKSDIIEESPAIDVSAFSQDIVVCKKCTKKFYASFDASSLFYVEECWHLFCLACIKKYIDDEFVNRYGNFFCPAKDCKKNISEDQIKQLIGEKKFDDLQNKAIRKMMNVV